LYKYINVYNEMASSCSSEDESTSKRSVIDVNDCRNDCTSDYTIDWMNNCMSDCGSNNLNDCTSNNVNNCVSDDEHRVNDGTNCVYDDDTSDLSSCTMDRSVIEVDEFIIEDDHIYDNVLRYVFEDANVSMLDMIMKSMTPNEIFIKTGIYMFSKPISYGHTISINNISCFMYLLKHGLDINEQNTKGDTPLHLALKIPNNPAVRFIIKKGGNLNIKNHNGNTPLHLYFQSDESVNRRLMKLVLESDYDFNNKNTNGDTPLHLYFSSHSDINIQLIESILKKKL
jgi:hypothetical protein